MGERREDNYVYQVPSIAGEVSEYTLTALNTFDRIVHHNKSIDIHTMND